MSKKIDNGGAAFPNIGNIGLGLYPEFGMSLRDYFAAKAMQAIIEADGIQYAEATDAHAKWAHEQADAMLAARGGQL